MKTGVLLLNMGSPTKGENARKYLKNLLQDPAIIKFPFSFLARPIISRVASRRRAPILGKKLDAIGGSSPMNEITERQARQLAAILNQSGDDWIVAVAMRYSDPSIEFSYRKLVEAGCGKIVACPLYPHYCEATTGSSFQELRRVSARVNPKIDLLFIESYHDHPGYIQALSSTVRDTLDELPMDLRQYAVTVFSAHGIPLKMAKHSPYVDQIRQTAGKVADALRLRHWRLAFQSRYGKGKWTTPTTEDTLRMLASIKTLHAVLVPISFVSDNLETLFDMDIVLKKEAAEVGISLYRAPAINMRPVFISALADLIRERAEDGLPRAEKPKGSF